MTLPLKPKRGGFLRPFGCAWFIREYLAGRGPEGSARIDPNTGAPQSDVFYEYKTALRRVLATDRAVREEERFSEREGYPINLDIIEHAIKRHLELIPYKSIGCRYHSFVVYFSNLQRLGWVEPTGHEEPSAFQDHYGGGQPRKFFRLTATGKAASDIAWANPLSALYGHK